LVENIWKAAESPHDGATKLQELGFTLFPSVKVSPPSIQECKAHLERVYDSDKRYGEEIWIFGEIVSVSINRKALEGSSQERYRRLNPIFYLEEKTYGTLGDVKIIQMKG
jgi:flavin reductase (DIM6/NTAB) family NADH-FMN oxidoreductase RutF